MEKFSYVNATSLEQVTSLLSESGWGEVMLIAGRHGSARRTQRVH